MVHVSRKRLFIAIPISESLQDEITQWEIKYQNLPVRWLKGKNLHITLIPPWYEENVEEVKELLQGIKGKIQPFNIEFKKVTYGPNFREPRLIWAEGDTPPEIVNLKTQISKLLDIPEERRPFTLHLTIARFRPQNFSQFPVKKLDEKVNWKENISSIALVEAHLLPTGAEYDILEEINL